jgi:hypothetical protein
MNFIILPIVLLIAFLLEASAEDRFGPFGPLSLLGPFNLSDQRDQRDERDERD